MDIPIAPRHRAHAPTVARNWARRLSAELEARYAGRFSVRWWAEEIQPASPYVQWIDLSAGERIAGRIRVRWDPARTDVLAVEATSEGLPVEKTVLGATFEWLGLAGAIGAFGLWVWFVIDHWPRIWNALASVFGPHRENQAYKLEFAWLLLGWAVGPVFVGLALGAVGGKLNVAAAGRRRRRMDAFARAELDAAIGQAVQKGRAPAGTEPQVAADLGVS